MSYMLPHLHNGWQVDQAILSEEDRVVVIRFGHDWDPTCMKMDEVLYSIAEKFCRLYRKCGTGCFWGGLRTFQSWQKAKGNRHVTR
ncbi:LOW QUALITY PROTEIN: TXNL4A isoform 7 [Pongo abelii]|uniref:TXNL4A isoform 7 n=1 Tax=Pongo abelii TaxID=9601 RepID=A0A2J8T7G2_PONAB|nr:LOW QUALITY PROTEIN: TXNL4A isoform 7 [Pongo abelii]